MSSHDTIDVVAYTPGGCDDGDDDDSFLIDNLLNEIKRLDANETVKYSTFFASG